MRVSFGTFGSLIIIIVIALNWGNMKDYVSNKFGWFKENIPQSANEVKGQFSDLMKESPTSPALKNEQSAASNSREDLEQSKKQPSESLVENPTTSSDNQEHVDTSNMARDMMKQAF